jgi:hypothetical protein
MRISVSSSFLSLNSNVVQKDIYKQLGEHMQEEPIKEQRSRDTDSLRAACEREGCPVCIRRVLEELRELVRKHDYRIIDEPRGNEMTSWRRGPQLCAGNRGIR